MRLLFEFGFGGSRRESAINSNVDRTKSARPVAIDGSTF